MMCLVFGSWRTRGDIACAFHAHWTHGHVTDDKSYVLPARHVHDLINFPPAFDRQATTFHDLWSELIFRACMAVALKNDYWQRLKSLVRAAWMLAVGS